MAALALSNLSLSVNIDVKEPLQVITTEALLLASLLDSHLAPTTLVLGLRVGDGAAV